MLRPLALKLLICLIKSADSTDRVMLFDLVYSSDLLEKSSAYKDPSSLSQGLCYELLNYEYFTAPVKTSGRILPEMRKVELTLELLAVKYHNV